MASISLSFSARVTDSLRGLLNLRLWLSLRKTSALCATCVEIYSLSQIFGRNSATNFDLRRAQSVLVTKLCVKPIQNLPVSLLEPAHHRRFMHPFRSRLVPALGSALKPASNRRLWLFHDAGDFAQLETVNVI